MKGPEDLGFVSGLWGAIAPRYWELCERERLHGAKDRRLWMTLQNTSVPLKKFSRKRSVDIRERTRSNDIKGCAGIGWKLKLVHKIATVFYIQDKLKKKNPREGPVCRAETGGKSSQGFVTDWSLDPTVTLSPTALQIDLQHIFWSTFHTECSSGTWRVSTPILHLFSPAPQVPPAPNWPWWHHHMGAVPQSLYSPNTVKTFPSSESQ